LFKVEARNTFDCFADYVIGLLKECLLIKINFTANFFRNSLGARENESGKYQASRMCSVLVRLLVMQLIHMNDFAFPLVLHLVTESLLFIELQMDFYPVVLVLQ
jgi:hypothetical protein